ncbi:MAG: hypothetical protein ACOX6T_19405 [Myxococcales bacterium]
MAFSALSGREASGELEGEGPAVAVANSPLPGLLESEPLEDEGPRTFVGSQPLPGLFEAEPPESGGPTTLTGAEPPPGLFATESPESGGPTTSVNAEPLPGLFEVEPPDSEGPAVLLGAQALPGLFDEEPPGSDDDSRPPTLPPARAVGIGGAFDAEAPALALSASALAANLDALDGELEPPAERTTIVPFPAAPTAEAAPSHSEAAARPAEDGTAVVKGPPASFAPPASPEPKGSEPQGAQHTPSRVSQRQGLASVAEGTSAPTRRRTGERPSAYAERSAAPGLDARIDQPTAPPPPEDSTRIIASDDEQKLAVARGAGAYSRRHSKPEMKAAVREPESRVPPDPALQARLRTVVFVLVGLVGGAILIWLLATMNRPTRVELEAIYPHGLLDTRHEFGVTLGARSVEFKYSGRVPCAPNGKEECLLYEYGRDSFKGEMVVRETDSGWQLVENRQ